MKCNVTDCNNYGFGCCCNGNKDEYDSGTPNDKNCPNYYSVEENGKNLRYAIIQEALELCEVVDIKRLDIVEGEFNRMTTEELLVKLEELTDLSNLHQANETLGAALKEIEEIGAEKFKKKYNVST